MAQSGCLVTEANDREGVRMPLGVFATKGARALIIFGVVAFTLGCQHPPRECKASPDRLPDRVTVQGELTVNDGGDGVNAIAAGKWCCKSCSGGFGGKPLKCTGCQTTSGTSSSACASASGGPTIHVDCTGNTTEDGSGTVTCF
jgi:hypothetical protein